MAKDLTKGNEGKLILQFAIPMLLGNIFQQLYNVIDSVIVGKFLGKEALAAVGASFPIIFMLISLVVGITMGSTVIISQCYGAKNYERIRLAISTMYLFMFFASIVVASVGIGFAPDIFRLMQLPQEILPQATTFLRIYFIGLPAFFGYNAVSAFLRGLGDSKTPLYFLIISTLVNIILDLLFIAVFHWGIAGAAIATIISQAGAFISAVWWLNRTSRLMHISLNQLKFDKKIFIQSIQIGLPTGLQQTIVAIGMMALMGIVNGFGTSVIAAYTVVGRIESLATLPAMNFSMAISTFVGQNLGAGRLDRVKTGLRATLKLSMLFSLIISAFVVIFGSFIMTMFTSDAEVIRTGHEYLIITGCFYVLFSTMFTFTGLFRGAGDTLIPMFFTLFSLWLVRIPLAYLFSTIWGTHGIWWAIPIGWLSGVVLAISYYKSGRWKRKIVGV